MRIFDLFAETVYSVCDSHRDWMTSHGVSRDLLFRGPAAFGVARIETSGSTFQFNDDGKPAVIVPVSDSYEIDEFEDGLTDLLAFLPDDPSRWWVLRDTMPVLNLEEIERAVPCMGIDEVLTVYETPLSWLQGYRNGIVILDWKANLRLWLGGVGRIWCDNESLAERLTNALSEPVRALPDIRFSEARHAA